MLQNSLSVRLCQCLSLTATQIFSAIVLVALALTSLARCAIAQQVPAGVMPASLNVISDTALSNATGHVSFNASAGQGNAQSNAAALGFGSGSVIGVAGLASEYQGAVIANGVRRNEDVAIRGDAFRAVRGVLSVNQSSGSGNAQANLVLLGIGGVVEITLDQLVQVSTPTVADSEPGARQTARRAEIADSAFIGARGIVQVNQSAGLGNRTANVFALNISFAVP
jgi:hypothetical protein